MTKHDATEWVREQADNDNFDEQESAELEEVFAAIFERPADADDREGLGLWSHLCAAVL